MSDIGGEIELLDQELRQVDMDFNDAMLRIPNPPEAEVPIAPDESGNVVVKQVGVLPQFDFAPLAHWDLGERLGILTLSAG